MADNKKLMVTGCNGQLGRALKQVYEGEAEYVYLGTDVADLDITDQEAVRTYVKEQQPYAIVNCAAATNVDGCEKDTDLAYRINAIGPRNLAIAANENNIKLLHISTDYVFPGNGSRPYTEFDETAPKSAYGRTKLAGENFVKQFAGLWFIIRTAWLYSEFGRNFLQTMLELTATRPEVKVVFDQAGTPTYARDLAGAILSVLSSGKGENAIYNYSNEGVCSWYDFAKAIAEMSGHTDCEISPCHSGEFPGKVRRPSYSVLDKTRIKETFGLGIPHWRESLRRCMDNL